jgi:hypothetical protein
MHLLTSSRTLALTLLSGATLLLSPLARAQQPEGQQPEGQEVPASESTTEVPEAAKPAEPAKPAEAPKKESSWFEKIRIRGLHAVPLQPAPELPRER